MIDNIKIGKVNVNVSYTQLETYYKNGVIYYKGSNDSQLESKELLVGISKAIRSIYKTEDLETILMIMADNNLFSNNLGLTEELDNSIDKQVKKELEMIGGSLDV